MGSFCLDGCIGLIAAVVVVAVAAIITIIVAGSIIIPTCISKA